MKDRFLFLLDFTWKALLFMIVTPCLMVVGGIWIMFEFAVLLPLAICLWGPVWVVTEKHTFNYLPFLRTLK